MAERDMESGMESGMESRKVPAPGRKRRKTDFGALVTGLFFLLVAGIFIAGGLSGDPVDSPEVLAPALVVGLGLVGIVRVITRGRRHR